MRTIIFSLLLLLAAQLEGKVRVLTFHYNLPELIEIQYKTLKRFVKEDYEFIVFNDARSENHEKGIQAACDKFGIRCVRFKPKWHETDPFNAVIAEWMENKSLYSHIGHLSPQQASVRHCHVIQYALDHFGYDNNDLVVLLDGDCFPIRPLSFKKLLGKNHIAGIRKEEGGYEYMWVVLSIFNPMKAPYKDDLRFNLDVIDNEIHDTGSHTYNYFKNHPDVKYQLVRGFQSAEFYSWSDEQLQQNGFTPNEIALLRDLDSLKEFPWPITVELHMNNHFLHLGNSSFDLPGHQEKRACVKRFISNILKK